MSHDNCESVVLLLQRYMEGRGGEGGREINKERGRGREAGDRESGRHKYNVYTYIIYNVIERYMCTCTMYVCIQVKAERQRQRNRREEERKKES